ncbi:hypothetical protein B0H12DRAFT_1331000 [Mycena haematopus]|nr:hypothetical protein B0H12DRAFT_1331000 [Mycena haematopus]
MWRPQIRPTNVPRTPAERKEIIRQTTFPLGCTLSLQGLNTSCATRFTAGLSTVCFCIPEFEHAKQSTAAGYIWLYHCVHTQDTILQKNREKLVAPTIRFEDLSEHLPQYTGARDSFTVNRVQSFRVVARRVFLSPLFLTSLLSIHGTVHPQTIYNTEDPFADEAADIIVRSITDNVDFRVQKAFLSVASPVFRSMFSLPQGEPQIASGLAESMKDGLPIMMLDEDHETLGTLLRMCYPRWMIMDCGPLFPNIERVLAVFTAAKKYVMDGVEREVREVLVAPRFVEPDPLRMFALMVKDDLYDEAKICARYTLRTPVLGEVYRPELEYITAGCTTGFNSTTSAAELQPTASANLKICAGLRARQNVGSSARSVEETR